MHAKVARRNASLPLAYPLFALLPAALILSLFGGTALGASTAVLLKILRDKYLKAKAFARRISRDLTGEQGAPRRLSRRLSGVAAAAAAEFQARRTRLRTRHVVAGGFVLIALKVFHQIRQAMLKSLLLMNPCEDVLQAKFKRQIECNLNAPRWGKGLPMPPALGAWRPYLHDTHTALENLQMIHGALGITSRRAEEMTLDQLVEGVRRVLLLKYDRLLQVTERFWSEEQARSIAMALAADCGLPSPLLRGGLEECVSASLESFFPWPTPTWLQAVQRWGIASLRPIFINAWRWKSRYIETPFGAMHVYDTGPLGKGHRTGQASYPPLILQHGAFVTGWSMALLGWFLSRQGRRVVIPDLFDFDYGLSTSKGFPTGDRNLRLSDALESLTYVVNDLLQEGASEVDLAGHSYGGYLAGSLAHICAQRGLPIRKLVLLDPGGPANLFNPKVPDALHARFLNDPMGTIDAWAPWWAPKSILKHIAKLGLGILFSANNTNLIFGEAHYQDMFRANGWRSSCPTLLFWGTHDIVTACREEHFLGTFLSSRFPQLDAFWVHGASHNIQIEAAVSVARVMHCWLDHGDEPVNQHHRGGLAESLFFFTHRHVSRMSLGSGAVSPVLRSKL